MPFLPVTPDELNGQQPDFIIVTGDAYVDHPSFGTAIISRVLEDENFSVAIISQPEYRSCDAFKIFGKPRLAFLVNSGNIDSMVAHYTVAKKKRNDDYYSPGGKAGYRPDRAVIVYCNRIREAYGDVPIIIGGIEASTRRFAHYDYWSNSIRRSILVDSRADMLSYGMGENITRKLAHLLDKGVPIRKIRDVRGTVFLESRNFVPHFEHVFTAEYDDLKNDRKTYAKAFRIQHENQDAIYGKAIIEGYDSKILVQNPPMPPLSREELDHVYSLPYMRTYHPMYEKDGGIPAIKEVKFSITHNRGCFGNCNFCSIAFHQGRTVTSRSIESCVKEAETIAAMPDFSGYIHDVGGPSANFRGNFCEKAQKHGVCKSKRCLCPSVCKNMKVDHSEYIELLKAIEKVKGVKKVFVRSGLRYDYMLADKSDQFFKKIVSDHVSGQLKVAPEHCSDHVLHMMGKPSIEYYKKFQERFYRYTDEIGKKQFLVPYLMSSHPGSTINDAIQLALFLKRNHINPEQVQDFYPTPGTVSTCMFWTGIDPFTGKEVFVTRDYEEKQLQRALLQWFKPENYDKVKKALLIAGRTDLIGFSDECLIKPSSSKFEQGMRTDKCSDKSVKLGKTKKSVIRKAKNEKKIRREKFIKNFSGKSCEKDKKSGNRRRHSHSSKNDSRHIK